MMLLLSGEEAKDTGYMKFAVEDIAATGFDAVCLEFRDSAYNEADAVGREAIRFVCDTAKANGIGFIIIMPHCAPWILKKHPSLRKKICKEYVLSVKKTYGRGARPRYRRKQSSKSNRGVLGKTCGKRGHRAGERYRRRG